MFSHKRHGRHAGDVHRIPSTTLARIRKGLARQAHPKVLRLACQQPLPNHVHILAIGGPVPQQLRLEHGIAQHVRTARSFVGLSSDDIVMGAERAVARSRGHYVAKSSLCRGLCACWDHRCRVVPRGGWRSMCRLRWSAHHPKGAEARTGQLWVLPLQAEFTSDVAVAECTYPKSSGVCIAAKIEMSPDTRSGACSHTHRRACP